MRASPTVATAAALLAAGAALLGWSLWSNREPAIEDCRIVAVAASKSGAWVAAGSAAGRLAVWKLARAGRPFLIRHHNGALNDIQFSPDEHWLVIADKRLTLRPLDRIDEPLVLRSDDRNYGTVRFSPSGETLLTVAGSGVIEILDSRSGRSTRSVCCSTIGGAVAFTPDGLFFVSAGHLPRVWDARTGKLVAQLTRDREFMALNPIAFRGQDVLMGSQDGGIRVWNLSKKESGGTSPRSSDWVDTIAVQERTGLVAYAGLGKTLRLWDPATNARSSFAGVRPTSNVVFSSPDGPLVVGRANGTVELWDIRHSARQAVLHFPSNN